jgi:hypothetical protein
MLPEPKTSDGAVLKVKGDMDCPKMGGSSAPEIASGMAGEQPASASAIRRSG